MGCFSFIRSASHFRGNTISAPCLGTESKSINSLDLKDAKTSKSFPSPRNIQELYKENEHKLRVFSLQELKSATNDFNRSLKIGEGGFGSVFKGSIRIGDDRPDLVEVAIKKLNKNSLQGRKQWLAEVQHLGVVDHPNLIKLIGYCSVDGRAHKRLLLVYEYMCNSSLEYHLFQHNGPPLAWKTRLEIILGAAKGLAHLHHGMEIQIIYRDFKTSNVLLDKELKPKLSDFGLAREGPLGEYSHVSTSVVGTYGYAAPEYMETAKLAPYSDVYSFGVVLYEILTGRRALELVRPQVERRLVEWVKLYPPESRRFVLIVDPRLRKNYSLKAAKEVATLANSCLNKYPKERPTMPQVVERLEVALKISNEETLFGVE